jgi:hypothetical protein
MCQLHVNPKQASKFCKKRCLLPFNIVVIVWQLHFFSQLSRMFFCSFWQDNQTFFSECTFAPAVWFVIHDCMKSVPTTFCYKYVWQLAKENAIKKFKSIYLFRVIAPYVRPCGLWYCVQKKKIHPYCIVGYLFVHTLTFHLVTLVAISM